MTTRTVVLKKVFYTKERIQSTNENSLALTKKYTLGREYACINNQLKTPTPIHEL